jgi:hypothetical protein
MASFASLPGLAASVIPSRKRDAAIGNIGSVMSHRFKASPKFGPQSHKGVNRNTKLPNPIIRARAPPKLKAKPKRKAKPKSKS